MSLPDLLAELKRRHVIRVTIAYVVVAWLVVQIAATIAPELELPGWTTRLVLVLAILGLPVAVVLSWLFDLSPTASGPPSPNMAPASGPPTGVPADRRRIAVLPFSSFSPGKDDDYFADGITEELTSVISRVSGLEVIARTSVMPYKTEPKPVSVIARELRVGCVLEGSVRRAGEKLRVTVQLIDTSNEAHIWSEDYDRELSDVFEIQSDIARAVAGALRVRLVPGERERIDKAPTTDLQAHDLYLLGRHHLNKRNHESLLRAIDLFEQALEKDPSYALASAGLGEAWMWASVGYVADAPPDAARRALAAAEEAVRLDDGLAETHAAVGLIRNLLGDPEAALPHLQRAIALNPSSAPAYQALATYCIARGDFDGQLRDIERAVELDPRSANLRCEAGWPHFYVQRYGKALERFREALALDPEYALAHFNVGNALEALGDLEGALAAYRRTLELGGLSGLTKAYMVRALSRIGRTADAHALTAELLERAGHESGLCLPLAVCYDALGEAEDAVLWIERARARNEPGGSWLHLEGFLPFENTRPHPRFQALLDEDARRFQRVARAATPSSAP